MAIMRQHQRRAAISMKTRCIQTRAALKSEKASFLVNPPGAVTRFEFEMSFFEWIFFIHLFPGSNLIHPAASEALASSQLERFARCSAGWCNWQRQKTLANSPKCRRVSRKSHTHRQRRGSIRLHVAALRYATAFAEQRFEFTARRSNHEQ